MLIFNKQGERVDPYSILPLKIDDYDLIYGGMTTGKTAVHRHCLVGNKKLFIDTDVMWDILTPEAPNIWDLKRTSPEVDNTLSSFIRFITHELALRSGYQVLTNMRFPFGRAIKIVRPAEDTYDKMVRRARNEGKSLKITKKQVIAWAQGWMESEPAYEYTVILDSTEFLSDVFGIRLSSDDLHGDVIRTARAQTLTLLEEQFPGSLNSLTHSGQGLMEFFKEKGLIS